MINPMEPIVHASAAILEATHAIMAQDRDRTRRKLREAIAYLADAVTPYEIDFNPIPDDFQEPRSEDFTIDPDDNPYLWESNPSRYPN